MRLNITGSNQGLIDSNPTKIWLIEVSAYSLLLPTVEVLANQYADHPEDRIEQTA